ncbi:MAG TPA: YceD family protein [Steroidobacteraceae bacterium]|jgi:uncharacterized protein|nr:YceD family protein [Steroidobacteraceae bacterium]
MSEPWSQLSDVDRLADRHAEVAFEIPVDQMPKVREQFASAGGRVRGIARFRREAGFRVADLEMSGEARLVCQRCLEPMQVQIEASAHVALLVSESEADRVPPELETIHVPENRIRVRDLVEEELLLTLPISPLHERAEECGAKRVPDAQAEAPVHETQRPFEQLGELLKRNH